MGSITPTSNDVGDDQSQNLNLSIEVKRPVKQELKQLLNWSLGEIRQIYAPFRRRKGSPLLTRSEFLRFIQLSRISSFHIYDNLIKTDIINVYEILSILVLTAYTSYSYKVHFFFNIFDFRCNKKLSYPELILMFKSIVRGFCFLTGQELPQNQLLEKYGHIMFSKADLNNDQLLELGEIQGWLQNSKEYLAIFDVFDPETPIKEDYYVFNSFSPYSVEDINIMTFRLNKIFAKQKIEEEDYLMLKPIVKIRKTMEINSSMMKTKSPTLHQLNSKKGKQNTLNLSHSTMNSNHKSATFFPALNKAKSRMSPRKKKFENIIIIKGRTITKKEVFELREYFGNMSGGKKHILIEDFIENFNQEKYNHMKSVAASLFNFLDKKQHGKIEFLDLVTKLYPNLTSKHLQIIQFWSDEYNKNFNFNTDKKVKLNREEEVKKRILPKTCIPRLEELFRFFDTEQKGFITIHNLKEILGRACTDKEISYLFDSSDADKDGKLTLKEFVHVLLPPDLQIQGLI